MFCVRSAGCAVVAVAVVPVSFALGIVTARLDVLWPSPRVAVMDCVRERAAVLLWVDPDQRVFLEAMSRVHDGIPPALFRLWFPYECVVAFGRGGDGKTIEVVFAASLRRFAGFLDAFRSDPERWQWLAVQRVSSVRAEGPGLWVVRSQIALENAPAVISPAGAPLRFDGSHAAELLVDNRHGVAAAVLHKLFVGADANTDSEAAESDWPAGLLLHVRTARLVADFREEDTLQVVVRADCLSTEAAREFMIVACEQQPALEKLLGRHGVSLDGAWTQRGTSLEGCWRLRGAAYAIARLVRYHRT